MFGAERKQKDSGTPPVISLEARPPKTKLAVH
jgi:hypothetical protein